MARGDLHSQQEIDEQRQQQEDSLNEQFAALGIQPDGPVQADGDDEPFYLWPEHVDAYALFSTLSTQWRHGPDGPTGLDYAAVLAHMRALRVRRRDFDELYAAVRVMEIGALEGSIESRRQ